MAAVDWWAISKALATLLEGVTDMGQTYAYEDPAPSTPCAYVRWRSIPLVGDTFDGGLTARGELVLIPGEMVTAESARTLLQWLGGGTGSLWAVVEADSDLGALVHSVTLDEAAQVGSVSTPWGERDGAVIGFEVLAGRNG